METNFTCPDMRDQCNGETCPQHETCEHLTLHKPMQAGNKKQRNRVTQGKAWEGVEKFLINQASHENTSPADVAERMLLKSSIGNNFQTIIKFMDSIEPKQYHDIAECDEEFYMTVKAIIELKQAVSMLESFANKAKMPF